MAVSKAQQKAVHKYVKANYDRMELTVPKGRRDQIKAHAAGQGESVNGFINRAIDETIQRDRGAQAAHSGAGAVSLSSEKQNAPQECAENDLTMEEKYARLRQKVEEKAKAAKTVKPAPVHNDLSTDIEAARMALADSSA